MSSTKAATLSCPSLCPLEVPATERVLHKSKEMSLSPPAFNLSQHQGLFQWVNSSKQVVKLLELQLQHQSFQRVFRVDFLLGWLVSSPCIPRVSQESSQAPSLKASILWYSAFFMVQLSQPYMATGKTIALTMQTFVGKVMSLLFNTLCTFCFSFPAKKQLSSNFMAAITICSNFRAQEEKICHCFHLLPLYSLWKILVDNSGPDNLYKISVSWVFSPF